AALRLRHGPPAEDRPACGEVPAAVQSTPGERALVVALAPEGELRTWPRLGGARAHLGRLPPALRLDVRGALRPPHDHPGRLLPVLLRLQPRLPQLAALHAADGVHEPRAGARDPPLRNR